MGGENDGAVPPDFSLKRSKAQAVGGPRQLFVLMENSEIGTLMLIPNTLAVLTFHVDQEIQLDSSFKPFDSSGRTTAFLVQYV